MTRVTFVGTNGEVAVDGAAGERLLDVAHAAAQPLEGTCGGVMACATCHVVVAADDWVSLAAASAAEEDLLDLVPGASRYSRLACQIVLAPGMATLRVRVVG